MLCRVNGKKELLNVRPRKKVIWRQWKNYTSTVTISTQTDGPLDPLFVADAFASCHLQSQQTTTPGVHTTTLVEPSSENGSASSPPSVVILPQGLGGSHTEVSYRSLVKFSGAYPLCSLSQLWLLPTSSVPLPWQNLKP